MIGAVQYYLLNFLQFSAFAIGAAYAIGANRSWKKGFEIEAIWRMLRAIFYAVAGVFWYISLWS